MAGLVITWAEAKEVSLVIVAGAAWFAAARLTAAGFATLAAAAALWAGAAFTAGTVAHAWAVAAAIAAHAGFTVRWLIGTDEATGAIEMFHGRIRERDASFTGSGKRFRGATRCCGSFSSGRIGLEGDRHRIPHAVRP